MYVERERVVKRAEKLQRRFFNHFKYDVRRRGMKLEEVRVPYCRRCELPSERKEMLEYLKSKQGRQGNASVNNTANRFS